MALLRDNGVKYLAADFTIAHVIYFLSRRAVEVTDSIGPVVMDIALPGMTRAVDALPDERKAYLYFRPSYPRVHAIRVRSQRSRDQVVRRLRDKGIPFRDVRLKFYELIIPDGSRLYARPPY
jgi:polyphosphate kinase 2 (PPK2 family)